MGDPEDVELTPRTVKRANPASWITPESIAYAQAGLPDLAFRRFVADQWTVRASHWLPPGAWQQCVTSPAIEDGEGVYVGVDVGGQRSATAVASVTDDLRCGVWIGHGDGAVIDAGAVIRELAGRLVLREVAFDPWRAGQLAAELEREGVLTTAFPQSDSRMIPASARLHAAVVEGRLQLPDLAELHVHAANTIARHGRRGWRLDRPDERTPNDAIIALCIAVEAAGARAGVRMKLPKTGVRVTARPREAGAASAAGACSTPAPTAGPASRGRPIPGASAAAATRSAARASPRRRAAAVRAAARAGRWRCTTATTTRRTTRRPIT